MDSKTREKILELLERDARLTTEEIAVMLGQETSDVADEIAKMEMEEAFDAADCESKSRTYEGKLKSIKRTRNRYSRYKLF